MRESASLSITVPRALRFIFLERLRRLWRLNATPARTLPVAVSRKRFFALDLVLSLGISVSSCFEVHVQALGHALYSRNHPGSRGYRARNQKLQEYHYNILVPYRANKNNLKYLPSVLGYGDGSKRIGDCLRNCQG